MKIYVVMVCCDGTSKVSQEAYRTLEEAQEFCSGRTDTIKVNDFLYLTSDRWYIISEARVL